MKDKEVEEVILELAENYGVWVSKAAMYMIISMIEDGEIVFLDEPTNEAPS